MPFPVTHGHSTRTRVLLSRTALRERVIELAEQITRDYAGRELVLVGVLKGAFVFLSDLCRQLDLPLTLQFVSASSYGAGTETSGEVVLTHDLTEPVADKHVLIVEDIVDTGLTMRFLLDHIAAHEPASLAVCALLHKPARTRVQVPIEYLGFTIQDRFVVGYGLDVDQRYRHLPDIVVFASDPG